MKEKYKHNPNLKKYDPNRPFWFNYEFEQCNIHEDPIAKMRKYGKLPINNPRTGPMRRQGR